MNQPKPFIHNLSYILYVSLGVVIVVFLFQMRRYLAEGNWGKKAPPRLLSSPEPLAAVQRPLRIRGSIPYWDQKAAYASFSSHQDLFHSVSLFWYYLTPQGTLATYRVVREEASLIQEIHEAGVKVSAVITNLPEEGSTTWDSVRVEKVLKDPELRRVHIEEITQKLSQLGFDGVTIDYEEVNEKARDDFSWFVKELTTRVHEQGRFVGIALHPKLGEAQDKLYRFQDWKDLAQAADELYIMAYGEHWDEGSPGPIASLEWVRKIVGYAKDQEVPLEKFYLGIPLYGYDWQDGGERALGLTYQEVKRLMERQGITQEWGEDTPGPYFSYEEKDVRHEVWFENAASVEEKIILAQEAGFGGVTFWRLGGEDTEVWERIRKFTTDSLATPSTVNQ